MADQPNIERLQRLEEEVNQRARDAFAGLREQIAQRLRRLSDEAREALEGLGDGDPPTVISAADFEPLAREADAGLTASELVASLASLDRARTQGEILSALAREAVRFADRTAVLLTRERGVELWAAEGWDDLPSELVFDYPSSPGWAPASFGRSAVELSDEAVGELARHLGAEAAERAVLVPLMLRDRLAAVVYADGGGDPLPLAAGLQVLTWAASQALESLPFRQREATATLAGLGAGEPIAEAPALWGGSASPPVSDREDGSTGRAVGFAAAGLAAAGVAAAGLVKARRDEDEDEGAAPSEAAASGEQAEASSAAFAAFDEIVLEEAPGPEVAAPPVAPPVAPPDEDERDDEPAGTEASASEVPGEDRREALEGDALPADGALATFAATEIATPRTAGFAPEAEEAHSEEPAAAAEAELDETHPTSPSVPMATAAAEPDGTAAETTSRAGGAQVAPPADLEGPGRAFAGRGETQDEEQSRHDEAKRLARLLVSEIRLYNEDEVEVGRRNGDIYERLKEDIDRSRQLYEERVDPRLREGTDYFYQELVRNLGGGDAGVLGI